MELPAMSVAIHSKPQEARQREQMAEFGRSLFERRLTAGSGELPSKESFLHRAMYQQIDEPKSAFGLDI
jgi:ribulose-5-phosphate 4-epimerase/fuculose-1-phosphate aldolase